MVVEAPVLRREHGLEQVVGHLLERQRVVVARAAMADLDAVAVEEGHGEDLVLQRVLAPFVKGGDGEGQHQEGAGDAEIEPFADAFDRQPLAAADGEAVGGTADALIDLATAARRAPQAGIDP